ncbi:glutamine amidotransferase-related protein [Streptomyces sp. GSL17-111]|uniref:glutamine amidotransferase-related protein n=1 Tax=Streptomyces sp. GSL17-111 TaxID=3121596 RepID=UPI0030F44CD2
MDAMTELRLALVGDKGNHSEPAHPKIESLLSELGATAEWLPTEKITGEADLDGFHGIWVVPGAPYLNEAGVQHAVRVAREAEVPFLGTCGGFFSALIGNALVNGVEEVVGVVEDQERYMALAIPFTCSFTGEKAPLTVKKHSRLASVYGHADDVQEVFHCSWSLDRAFMEAAVEGEMEFVAWDADGAPRALELEEHPFFLACLFQPELTSTPTSVHPLIAQFLTAAEKRAAGADPASR